MDNEVEIVDWDDDQRGALNRISEWFEGCEEANGEPVGCTDPECTGGGSGYWHTHGTVSPAPVLSLGGLAGSGKTTLMRAVEAELGVRAVYGTPTHKAASVLRRKMDDPAQAGRVRTYHSMVYTAVAYYRCRTSASLVREDSGFRCEHGQGSGRCDRCTRVFTHCGGHGKTDCQVVEEVKFDRREYVAGIRRLIVVDEASMLTEEQVQDIRSFGIPVLLCGDHGQLPPVQGVMNPWMQDPDLRLEGNHRNGDGSEGIVDTARAVRSGARLRPGSHAPGLWTTDRRTDGVMDYFTADGFPPNPDRAVICWTNRVRAAVNSMFHGSGPVRAGDRVIALKRGEVTPMKLSKAGVFEPDAVPVDGYNGMTGTVREVIKHTNRRVRLVIELDDPMTVWLDDIEEDEDGSVSEKSRKVTVRYVHTLAASEQFGRPTDLPLNGVGGRPSGSMLWDYAYAITAHKAQGSEYDSVIILDERPMDYERWMYTALTRAKRQAVVVRW